MYAIDAAIEDQVSLLDFWLRTLHLRPTSWDIPLHAVQIEGYIRSRRLITMIINLTSSLARCFSSSVRLFFVIDSHCSLSLIYLTSA